MKLFNAVIAAAVASGKRLEIFIKKYILILPLFGSDSQLDLF